MGPPSSRRLPSPAPEGAALVLLQCPNWCPQGLHAPGPAAGARACPGLGVWSGTTPRPQTHQRSPGVWGVFGDLFPCPQPHVASF